MVYNKFGSVHIICIFKCKCDKDGLTMKIKRKTKKKKIQLDGFWKNLIKYTIIFGVIAVLITGFSLIHYSITSMPINYDTLSLDFSSVIYAVDQDGNPVHYTQVHDEENRLWVSSEDIPLNLKNAFVAIEDERFYKHGGVDIPRTIKATLNFVFRKDDSFGGSTINQQLVKNLTGNRQKSVERKATEIIRAIHLDSKLEKDQILELYLNTIYLSQGCYGVKTASEKYFDKDVKDLTLAECASIASITQLPTMYDPILNPDNNKEKQERVLGKMLELKMISEEEYEQAKNEHLDIKDATVSSGSVQSSFTDYMLSQVIEDLQKELGVNLSVATNMVYSGGLQIYSTVDIKTQNTIEEVFGNPEKYLGASYNPESAPQSAIVVINPKTGAVVGMRGELGEKEGSLTLNRATDAPRQPGSSIKPLSVYAPGFELKRFTANTVFVDEPYTAPNGHVFRNSNGEHAGPISVRSAIAASSNIVAVKSLEKLGIENSYNFMVNNFHFTTMSTSDKALSPLACGGLTNGVTVLEMTAAYNTFANNGIYTKPYTYTKITDMDGNVILEKEKDSSVSLSESTSYSILQCLRSVVTGGTGTAANFSSKYYICGKTGTSDDYKDRWFMGITPYYVGGVWFGYDQPKTVSGYWGNPAITLWKAVMKEIHDGLPNKDFASPQGMVTVEVCSDSGMLAGPLCSEDYRGSRVYSERMTKVAAPKSTCTIHKKVMADKESNMVASEFCPAELLEERVMAVFPDATQTCTTHGQGANFESPAE